MHPSSNRPIRRRPRTSSIARYALLACFLASLASAQGPPANVSVTPASGTGASQTFAFTSSSPAGHANILWMEMVVNPYNAAAHSCFIAFWPANLLVALADDNGNTWPEDLKGVLGSATPLQNSQCRVDLGTSSVVASGNNVTVNLALTFRPGVTGTQQLLLQTGDNGGLMASWQQMGTWTVTAPTVTTDTVTPASGSGSTRTFALQYTDTAGASNFSRAWVWFNATFAASSANSCLLYYDRPASTLYLLNDAASQWMPGTLGGGSTLQNTQCAVNLAGSSVVLNANTLTLNLAVTFKPVYAGAKNIFMYGSDSGGAVSGWQTRGTWTAPAGATVAPVSVTPASGTGSSQTFELKYSDSAGAANLSWVWVWFNATFAASSANSCMLYYDRPAGTLYLLNDAASQWMPATPGAAGALQNSQCSVNLPATSVSLNGSLLTLTLALTFKPAFPSVKNVYMYGADIGGTDSGWQNLGTWTAPNLLPPSNVSVTPASGTGTAQTFAFTSSSPGGAANILWMEMVVNTDNIAVHSCFLAYWPGNLTVGLAGDLAKPDDPGFALGVLGSPTPLQNSQCRVDLVNSSVVTYGNSLTVNLALTFLPGYTGSMVTLLQTSDYDYLTANWQQMGTWNVGTAPAITTTSLSGTSGLPFSQSLAATGGSAPYTWTLQSGPQWLALSSSGVISGTPTVPGTYTINVKVTGADGASSPSSPVSIIVTQPSPDFGVTISNGDQSIVSGGAITYAGYNVTLLPQPGYAGPVTLTWTSSPALSSQNVSINSNVLPVGGSWTTTMIVTPPVGTTTGAWDITVKATSAAFVHTVVAHFAVVNGPDFTVIVTPPSTPITAGQSGVYGVRVNAVNGLDAGTSVNLSLSSFPAGASATPDVLTLLADGSTRNVTISTSTNTPSGSFLVNAIGGGKSHAGWPSLTTQGNSAGTYTISGQVQQPNGIGIGGTTFQVRDSQNVIVPICGVAGCGTDDSGNYSIPPLASGQYTVTASSPYGVFSPASITYNLSTAPGLSGQHRRLMTMIVAPPDEPPPSPARHGVKLPIGNTTTTLWYFPIPEMDARNIQDPPGCWASPSDSVKTTVTLPTQASVYFTVVFDVAANATAGAREFYCSYKSRINGHDVVQPLDGLDYLVLQPKLGGRITSNSKGMTGFTVAVTVNGTSREVQTDANGYYSIPDIDDASNVTIMPAYHNNSLSYPLQFAAVPNQGGQCGGSPITCFFYNMLGNKTQDFTVQPFTTVFLLHGIGQNSTDMNGLWRNLTGQVTGQPALDLSRFVVDTGFTFTGCNPISAGGLQLAQYIATKPPSGIVLLGYSMGGLVARNLLVSNYDNVLADHPIVGLITMGTPNWGYPYIPIDAVFKCPAQVQDMDGGWNPLLNDPGTWFLSPFLQTLRQNWRASSYGRYWFAAAGTDCKNPVRIGSVAEASTGCLYTKVNPSGEILPNNDGVVCRDSALYSANSGNPTSPPPNLPPFEDPGYVHTHAANGWGSGAILCGNDPSATQQLFNPDPQKSLFQRIVQVITNGQ